ncbi:MAG: RnfH family protein [Granulosicoccus sp.]
MTNSDQTDISIEVVYALPEEQQVVKLRVPSGTCARDATNQALEQGLVVLAEADLARKRENLSIGVYGQLVNDEYTLNNGDRLEIYRPLLQDPKERRRKIARQG